MKYTPKQADFLRAELARQGLSPLRPLPIASLDLDLGYLPYSYRRIEGEGVNVYGSAEDAAADAERQGDLVLGADLAGQGDDLAVAALHRRGVARLRHHQHAVPLRRLTRDCHGARSIRAHHIERNHGGDKRRDGCDLEVLLHGASLNEFQVEP